MKISVSIVCLTLFFFLSAVYGLPPISDNVVVKITLLNFAPINNNQATSSNLKTGRIYGTVRILMSAPNAEVTDRNWGKMPSFGKNAIWDKKPNEFVVFRQGYSTTVNTGCSFEVDRNDVNKASIIIFGDLSEYASYPKTVTDYPKNAPSPFTEVGGENPLDTYGKSDQIIRLDLKSIIQSGGKKSIKQRFGNNNIEFQANYLIEIL